MNHSVPITYGQARALYLATVDHNDTTWSLDVIQVHPDGRATATTRHLLLDLLLDAPVDPRPDGPLYIPRALLARLPEASKLVPYTVTWTDAEVAISRAEWRASVPTHPHVTYPPVDGQLADVNQNPVRIRLGLDLLAEVGRLGRSLGADSVELGFARVRPDQNAVRLDFGVARGVVMPREIEAGEANTFDELFRG